MNVTEIYESVSGMYFFVMKDGLLFNIEND